MNKKHQLVVMYEVPEMDLIPTNDSRIQLISAINKNYGDWFTVIRSELFTKELHNSNTVICYDLVILIDMSLVTLDRLSKGLKQIESDIYESFEKFLKINNYQNYRKIS